MLIHDLFANYRRACRRYDIDRDKFVKQLPGYKGYPAADWIGMLVKPIAKGLEKLYGRKSYIIGPSGIASRIVIFLYKKGQRKNRKSHLSISLEPYFCELNYLRVAVVNYGSNLKRYQEGSLGEINGMNFPTRDIPVDAKIEWFKEWISVK